MTIRTVVTGAHPAAAIAVAALLTVSACSGGDDPAPGAATTSSATASTSSSSSATESPTDPGITTAQQLTEQILTATDDSPVLATVRGTVEASGGRKSPVVAEILEVRANAGTTLLRWRLKSQSGSPVPTYGSTLSPAPLFDSRSVTVVDRTGKQALNPFTFATNQTGCVCSEMPQTVDGTGEPMYGLYPPLGRTTATVDVKLPGFAAAKGVTVTRS